MKLRALCIALLLASFVGGCSEDDPSRPTPTPAPDPYETAARALLLDVETAVNAGGAGLQDSVTEDFRYRFEPPWARADGVWDADYEGEILARMVSGVPGQRLWDDGQLTIPPIDSLSLHIDFDRTFPLLDPDFGVPDGRHGILAWTHGEVLHTDGTRSAIAEVSFFSTRVDAATDDAVTLRMATWETANSLVDPAAEPPTYSWGFFKAQWQTYEERFAPPPVPDVLEARFDPDAGADRNRLRLTWTVPESDMVFLFAYWLEVGPTAAAVADGEAAISHEIFRSYTATGDDTYTARIDVDDADLDAFQWGRLVVQAYNRQRTIGEVFAIVDPR